MKLIYPYFIKNLNKILAGILCMIFVDAVQIIIPQIIKDIVDKLAVAGFDTSVLAIQCLFILGLGLLMALLRYGWRNLLMGSARSVERNIRDDLYRRVLGLDMTYLDKVKTGDIMAHAVSDINHIRMAFGFGLIVLVDIILLGGATIAIMIWTHPKLSLFVLLPMPLLILVTRNLGKKMHTFHTDAQASLSALTEMVRESFSGIRVIKVFNFEGLTSGKVQHRASDYFKKNMKRAFIMALLRPVLILFFHASSLIIIFYGGYLVIQQQLSPGEFTAFLQYLGILTWPMIAIGWITNLFQRGMASLKRINTLMDTRLTVTTPDHPVKMSTFRGDISFKNVSFTYDPKENQAAPAQPTLKGIDFTIARNEKIGITGPPGSGKTSLVQLIPRLYDVQEGQVCINGADVKTIDLDQLRTHIALMPQEAFLFSGTIKDNILMGRACDQKRLDQVLNTCCLEHTVKNMPDGLETHVGERGVTLSGGQKQRIALARTLMTTKPVMILDDPISQMDTDTAATVISRLNQMHLDAAVIIISHRISALSSCSRILILNKGEIERIGSHEELMAQNHFYRTSVEIQAS